jgi:cob(I)alamin adenosyltransferase
MKIYTKSGDAGTTGLFAGPRVSKDDARIVAYGTVDELNAYLGVVLASFDGNTAEIELNGSGLFKIIQQVQSDLFCIGAELATPDPDSQGMRLFPLSHIELLETAIDCAEGELPKLTNFILPGGAPTAAQLHFARTVCRRAERELVSLTLIDGVADYSQLVVYLNRLGDFLFVLARLVNHKQGCLEPVWQKPV